MHPIEQHTGHPLQPVRQGGQTLDRLSDGAVDNKQHLVHHLTLLELPVNLSQTCFIIYPGLNENQKYTLNFKTILKLFLVFFIGVR